MNPARNDDSRTTSGECPVSDTDGLSYPAEDGNGLLLAEKSISVSHIVNGCTRLQPCVMLIGQAVGALAALAIKKGEDR
ncbi:MAG: FAD-dependent oxidoreductase [Ignavibacteriales bacterium]|nr:FAD-dependent oxidoreductase [Ignavibacteriales bacterium]